MWPEIKAQNIQSVSSCIWKWMNGEQSCGLAHLHSVILKVCYSALEAPISITVCPLAHWLSLGPPFFPCLRINIALEFSLQRLPHIRMQCQLCLCLTFGCGNRKWGLRSSEEVFEFSLLLFRKRRRCWTVNI